MAFIGKMFLMLFGKFSIEKILALVLQWSVVKFNEMLGDVKLSERAKMLVQNVYLLASTLGTEWVDDTKMTNIDNELVSAIVDLSKSIAEKHDFKLPIIPV